MAAAPAARGLTALRLLLGVFFLFQGLAKLGWFTDPTPLTNTLGEWLEGANAWNRTYLERFCVPTAPVLARLVVLGELGTGLAFILGAYARIAAAVALLMVLNFHFASGVIFRYEYLTNGYGPPVLGGLLALAIGGASLPLSVRKG